MSRRVSIFAVRQTFSCHLENLLGPWTLGGIVERDVLEYPLDLDMQIGWISHDDLGALMAAAIEHPELAPLSLRISGVENVTGVELAARISDGIGRTITFQPITSQAFGDLLERYMGPGTGAGTAAAYEFQRANKNLIPMWTDMTPVLEKLPVHMTSITEWARRVAPMLSRQPQTT